MPSTVARSVLFLSSYSPLFIVLAVEGYSHQLRAWIAVAVLVTISVVSVGVLVVWLRVARRFAPYPSQATHSSPRDDLAVAYIVTYILPFLGLQLGSVRDLVALTIVFFITLAVAVRSDLFYVNPLLNLLGYHIHEIEDDNGISYALISRRAFVKPRTLSVVSLDPAGRVRLERI